MKRFFLFLWQKLLYKGLRVDNIAIGGADLWSAAGGRSAIASLSSFGLTSSLREVGRRFRTSRSEGRSAAN